MSTISSTSCSLALAAFGGLSLVTSPDKRLITLITLTTIVALAALKLGIQNFSNLNSAEKKALTNFAVGFTFTLLTLTIVKSSPSLGKEGLIAAMIVTFLTNTRLFVSALFQPPHIRNMMPILFIVVWEGSYLRDLAFDVHSTGFSNRPWLLFPSNGTPIVMDKVD